MGKDRNCRPSALHVSASVERFSSAHSSDVSKDTITSSPARRHARTSSTSQSPPRGRAAIARRPVQESWIQNSSLCMQFSVQSVLWHDLSGQRINLHGSIAQNLDAMVTIKHRTVRPDLKRMLLSRLQGVDEFLIGPFVEFCELGRT